jgi:hypothetical protein
MPPFELPRLPCAALAGSGSPHYRKESSYARALIQIAYRRAGGGVGSLVAMRLAFRFRLLHSNLLALRAPPLALPVENMAFQLLHRDLAFLTGHRRTVSFRFIRWSPGAVAAGYRLAIGLAAHIG